MTYASFSPAFVAINSNNLYFYAIRRKDPQRTIKRLYLCSVNQKDNTPSEQTRHVEVRNSTRQVA